MSRRRRRKEQDPEAPPAPRLTRPAGLLLALAVLLGLGLAGYGLRAVPVTAPGRRPQNVLLVTVDTLRADALGAYGNARAATPWMDRLASRGLRFANAHAHNVVTLPSHANILSGVLPFVHGVRDNAGFRFPADRPTLATLLKERGYRTGAFVSAFPLDSRFGLARGFDVYDDAFVQAGAPSAFLVQERTATETVGRARRWIDAQGAEPWLCWVHVFDPHFPYQPAEPFASRFADAYAGEVAAVDAALGPLLGPALEDAAGRTLVVLTADHGESLGEHGESTHGVFAYESTLRVPLLVYPAPGLGPGVREGEAQHVDVVPTVLDILGMPVPAGLAGVSLAGAGGRDRLTYFEALSSALNRGWAPLHGVIDRGVKYVDLPEPELYDLRKDVAEVENLAAARPLDPFREALGRFPGARERGSRRVEDAGTRERLKALGYVSGEARATTDGETDPKRLIALDVQLQEVVASYRAGDVRGALEAARALVARRPDTVALLHLAHLERESGDLPAAIRSLRRAHAADPGAPTVAALLGAYLTQAGHAGEAADVLQPLAAAPTPDLEVLFARSLALASLGRTDESLAHLQRARELDAASGLLLLHEGTVRLLAGDRRGARRALAEAAALEDAPARAVSALALLDAEDGRHAEALAGFERAVAADPGESTKLLAAGGLLRQRGREPEARPYLELFSRVAPAPRFGPELARVREWLARARG